MPDENKIQTPDYDPDNPRCDQKQLKFLRECIAERAEGIEKWNQWRRENEDIEIWLQKADLGGAHLENACLSKAHLEGVEFSRAHLEGAYLWGTHLEKAYLNYANLENANLRVAHLENAVLNFAGLEGAIFIKANLHGANFSGGIVDGKTLIWVCEIDRNTKFEGVGLDSARIQPHIKQRLEYNIRKSNWCLWYEKHPKLKWLVKPFWLMSDYGKSTGTIISTFLKLAFIFATVYFVFGAYDYYLLGIKDNPGIVNDLFVPVTAEKPISYVYYGVIIYLRSLYFSVVTMTTLGFGDMYANTASFGLRWWLGHLLLIFQVIFGYVLLGALVTRFAVLFTAGGPAGKFEPMTKATEKLLEKAE